MGCSCSDAIRDRLWAEQDLAYREFQSALIPTVPKERIIGVRMPVLRQLARSLDREAAARFCQSLPHPYYEEDNLQALLIGQMGDWGECLAAVEGFLPYVDNWATCDSLRPKVFARERKALLPHIRRWLGSERPYTLRFAMEMLMVHYLEGDFAPEYLDWVAAVNSQEYYVNMMSAWYFATALAKQYDGALPYLTQGRLDPWVHNKSIQKALESRRISPEQKAQLRAWKR